MNDINNHLANLVTSDPEIMGATVCFTGTRVPVQTLFDFLSAGDSIERFLLNFHALEESKYWRYWITRRL